MREKQNYSWIQQLSEESKLYHQQILTDSKFKVFIAEVSELTSYNVPKWHPMKRMDEPDHAYYSGIDDGMDVLLQFLNGDFYGKGDKT